MIILPGNIAKTIITVNALSVNTIYLVYRSMNGNINLIVNHYGKSGARVLEFDNEMREISKLIRAVRRKYPKSNTDSMRRFQCTSQKYAS